MALVIKDRVRETSGTTSTATYAFSGGVVGFQTFSAGIGNGNTTPYRAFMGANWEVGVGTVGPGTLARTTVVASSNGNNPVNWGIGTKDITCSPYAAIFPLLTLANNWRENQTVQGADQDIVLEARTDGNFTPRIALRKANTTAGHVDRHWQLRIDSDGEFIIRDNTEPADRLVIGLSGGLRPGAATQSIGTDTVRWGAAFFADHISLEKAADVEVDIRATGDNATPVLRLRKSNISADTARNWTLGVNTVGNFRIRDDTTLTNRLQITTTGIVASGTDNTQSLGTNSNRWSEVHAANGTIQTSDERLKTDIEDAALGIEFILNLRPVSFCWRDGPDRTGRHHGLIAQEVLTALDGREFAGLRYEEDRYGLSYAELVPVLIKGAQELAAQVQELKERVATLELQMAQLR